MPEEIEYLGPLPENLTPEKQDMTVEYLGPLPEKQESGWFSNFVNDLEGSWEHVIKPAFTDIKPIVTKVENAWNSPTGVQLRIDTKSAMRGLGLTPLFEIGEKIVDEMPQYIEDVKEGWKITPEQYLRAVPDYFNKVGYDLAKIPYDLASALTGFFTNTATQGVLLSTFPKADAGLIKDFSNQFSNEVGSFYGSQKVLPVSNVSEVVNTILATPFMMATEPLKNAVNELPLSDKNKLILSTVIDVGALVGGAEVVRYSAKDSVKKVIDSYKAESAADKIRVAELSNKLENVNLLNKNEIIQDVHDLIEKLSPEEVKALTSKEQLKFMEKEIAETEKLNEQKAKDAPAIQALVEKIEKGEKEFTPAELQLQQNYPREIETGLREKKAVADEADRQIAIQTGKFKEYQAKKSAKHMEELWAENETKAIKDAALVENLKKQNEKRVEDEIRNPLSIAVGAEARIKKLVERADVERKNGNILEADRIEASIDEWKKIVVDEYNRAMKNANKLLDDDSHLEKKIIEVFGKEGELFTRAELKLEYVDKASPKKINGEQVLYELTRNGPKSEKLYALESGKIVDAKGEQVASIPKLGQMSLFAEEATKVRKGKKSPRKKIAEPAKQEEVTVLEKNTQPKVTDADVAEALLVKKYPDSPGRIKELMKGKEAVKNLKKTFSSETWEAQKAELEGRTSEVKAVKPREFAEEAKVTALDKVTEKQYSDALTNVGEKFKGTLRETVAYIKSQKGEVDLNKEVKLRLEKETIKDLEVIAKYWNQRGKDAKVFVEEMVKKFGEFIRSSAETAWKNVTEKVAQEFEEFKRGVEESEKFKKVEEVKSEGLTDEQKGKMSADSEFAEQWEKEQKGVKSPSAKDTLSKEPFKNSLEAKKFIKENVKTAHDLVDLFDYDVDPIYYEFAQALKAADPETLKQIKVTMNEFSTEESPRSQFLAGKTLKISEIGLNFEKSTRLETVMRESMHELFHSGTSRKLSANPEVKSKMNEVMRYAKEKYLEKNIQFKNNWEVIDKALEKGEDVVGATPEQERILYSFRNVNEFVANIASEPGLQKFLKNTRWKEMNVGTIKSLWNKAVEVVTEAWGGKIKYSVFDKAMSHMGELLETPEPKRLTEQQWMNLSPLTKENDKISDLHKAMIFAEFQKIRTERLSSLKRFGDPTTIASQRQVGGMTRMPITDAEVGMLKAVKNEASFAMMKDATTFFKQLDDANRTMFGELFQKDMRISAKNAKIELDERNKLVYELWKRKGLNLDSAKNIYVHAVAQQKGGMNILNEMGIKPERLSKGEKEMYDIFREFYESDFQRLQEARVIAGRAPLPYIENYFTFARVLEDMHEKGINPVMADISLFVKGMDRPFPFEKRAESKRALELNALSAFQRYSKYSIDYIHKAPVVAKLREMIETRWKKGKQEVGLADTAPAVYEGLNKWINIQAGLPHSRFDTKGMYSTFMGKTINVDKTIRDLTHNNAIATLAMNFRTPFVQFAAVNAATAELGVKYMTKGIQKGFSEEAKIFAEKESNVLHTRANEQAITDSLYELTLSKLHQGGSWKDKSQALYDAIKTKGMWGITYTDKVTARSVWLGAYDKARDEGMNHSKAIDYADDVVVRTQGSAARTDISPVQSFAIGKALTSFGTFGIARWNWYKDLVKNITEDPKKGFGIALRYVAMTALLNSFYEDVIGMQSPEPAPFRAMYHRGQKDDATPINVAWAGIKEVVSQHPLLQSSVRYGAGMGGAVLDLISDITTYPEKAIEGKGGYLPPYSGIELVGKMKGVPGTSALMRVLRAAKKDREDAREYVFGRVPGSEEE